MFSLQVLGQILEIFYSQKDYLHLATYQDLMDNNIETFLFDHIADVLNKSDEINLHKFADYVKTYNISQLQNGICQDTLFHTKGQEVACDLSEHEATTLARDYGRGEHGWIFGKIDEPLLLSGQLITLQEASPYKQPFDKIWRRIFESGMFTRSLIKYHQSVNLNNLVDLKLQLNEKIILILLIGHSLAFLILVIEIACKYIQVYCIKFC